MKNPSPRDLRNAVVISVLLTAIVVLALFDPSCRRDPNTDPPGPTRLSPNH
ncbi:MAG: hypothetical protein JNN01_01630 [Opitutaceae bacterium]|nr:hypothetical protein [Opitutaceae bacterium]